MEMCVATGMLIVGLTVFMVTIQSAVSETKTVGVGMTVQLLNSAQGHYRRYVKMGFAPSSAWSATTREGVVAELRKPLSRGDQTVQLVKDEAFTDTRMLELVCPRNAADSADDFTANAVWFAKK